MINKKEIKSIKATILRLPPETHKLLRIAAIEAGISMNDAINQAVELWLKERKRARKAVRK
jgi:predicted HicB family RNase H-like nuclease